MARVIGYVKSFEQGTFFVKDAKGEVHKLKAGDAIHQGELVYGAPNNPKEAKIIIDVTLQGAGDLVIAGNGALVFDTSLLKGVFSHDDAVVYINSVNEALAVAKAPPSPEKTEAGDETAAGDVVTDSERMNDTFAERDGTIRDVNTALAIETAQTSEVTPPTDSFRPVDLNNAPTALGAEISVDEDGIFEGTLPEANDIDGDEVTYNVATAAENGTVVINPDGTYTYTPNENYNGTDSFEYTVSDGQGGSNTYTVAIGVNPINDAPTAAGAEISVDEDGIFEGTLPEAYDIDGDDVTYNVATAAENGTVVINPDGTYTYTPNENYNGPDSFEYTVSDGQGGSNTYTVVIGVNPINDAPTAAGAEISVDEDGIFEGTLPEADDIDGDDVTYALAIEGEADHGTVEINPDGSYTYTPYENYNGTDWFAYTVSDGNGGSNRYEVSITVNPVNDAPTILVTGSTVIEDVTPAGATVATFSTEDLDSDETVDFKTGTNTEGYYTLGTGADLGKVFLSDTGKAFLDANGILPDVELTVTDGDTSVDATATILTELTNDAPVIALEAVATFNENDATVNMVVANITTLSDEEDGVPSVDFTAGTNNAGYYEISGNTVVLTQEGVDAINAGTTLPEISLTATDSGTPALTDVATATPTYTAQNDAPVIALEAVATFNENDATVNMVVANITTLSDEEDGVPSVDFTAGTNNAGYYEISGNTVVLTQEGVDAINAGTTLPEISLTATDSGTPALTDVATATPTVSPEADMPTLTLTSKEYGVTTNVEEIAFTGTYSTVAVSSLDGGVWHTDNSGGTVEVGYSSTYGVSGSSNKVLELERNPGDPSNLYTTMDVKAGEVYALSFDYANRSGDTSDMSVYWNGQLVAVINPSSTTLTPYTINLISEITGTGKLELKANDSNSIGVVLDNIALNLVSNTGYAGYLANLPVIIAGLTDSSETLAVTLSGIPAGYSLTDGINTASTSTVDISGWSLASISLIAPSGTSTTSVTLSINATSTESDGSSVTTGSQNIVISILADTTGYLGSTSADTLTGNSNANTLWGLDGDDTLDGGNGRDSLIGGGGNDTLITDFETTSSSMSGDYVMDGGIGIDTLIFDKNNTSIDFSILNSMNNPINNIEIIDLEQGGNSTKHTLSNLSIQDVIDMTDANNTLTILGDASDTVNIPSATGAYSVSTDSTSEAGFDIYTYTSTNASDPTVVLKIDSDIQQ